VPAKFAPQRSLVAKNELFGCAAPSAPFESSPAPVNAKNHNTKSRKEKQKKLSLSDAN